MAEPRQGGGQGQALNYTGDLAMYCSALYYDADYVNNTGVKNRPTSKVDYLTKAEWEALGTPGYGVSFYDTFGNVALSPSTPNTGAGIAILGANPQSALDRLTPEERRRMTLWLEPGRSDQFDALVIIANDGWKAG